MARWVQGPRATKFTAGGVAVRIGVRSRTRYTTSGQIAGIILKKIIDHNAGELRTNGGQFGKSCRALNQAGRRGRGVQGSVLWVVDDAFFAGWDQDGHEGIHIVLVAMEIEVVLEQPMGAFGVGILQRSHTKMKRVPDGGVGGVGDIFVGGVVGADETLSKYCVGGGC